MLLSRLARVWPTWVGQIYRPKMFPAIYPYVISWMQISREVMDVGELGEQLDGRLSLVEKTNRVFPTGNDSSVWTPYLKFKLFWLAKEIINVCLTNEWQNKNKFRSLTNLSSASSASKTTLKHCAVEKSLPRIKNRMIRIKLNFIQLMISILQGIEKTSEAQIPVILYIITLVLQGGADPNATWVSMGLLPF